jgi:2-amino-4,5-dihydroxy-6-oxo-7-(phosphonooxy)heptanoate synthase
MSAQQLTGKAVRMARLSRGGDDRYLFVPLDHSLSDGPITSAEGFDKLVADVLAGGADAVVVHKGRARMLDPALFADRALVIHLSASTAHAPDADAKVLVGNVEEAVRLGADAVSVHVNIGSGSEAAQLTDLGTVATACAEWGMPLLAMMYPRGPHIADPADPRLLAHVVNIAADLGVDIVKTHLAAPVARMAEVVELSPVPVVAAGGAPSGMSLGDLAASALSAGCRGLAVGRRVFASQNPRLATRELAAVIHGPGIGSVPVPRPTAATNNGR